MALKRYYISDNEYEYFLRLFRKARELSWFQAEEDNAKINYWYADIDFENIPKQDKDILGEDCGACLERLKRDLQTEPPTLSDTAPPSSSPPFFKRRVRKKNKGIRFILNSMVICMLMILLTAYHVNAPSESLNGLKKPLDFMSLLQESISTPRDDAEIFEPDIAKLLSRCQKHLEAKRLTTGKKGTALNCYQEILRLDPGNVEAQAGLQNIEMQYVAWIKKALRQKNLEKARQYLKGLERVNPGSPDMAEFRQQLAEPKSPGTENAKTNVADNKAIGGTDTVPVKPRVPDALPKISDTKVIAALLGQCQRYVDAKQLTTGKGETALGCYREVLKLAPDNADAKTGLKKIENQYVRWTKKALRGRNLEKVREYLAALAKVNPESPDLAKLKEQLAKLGKKHSKKNRPQTTVQRNNSLDAEDLTQISLGTGFNN